MRQGQEIISTQEILLLIYIIFILLFIAIFTVVFVIAFQKRKNRFLIERLEATQRFEKELERSKHEIQEQTLKNIAWELHDNVGQLLSVISIQLNMLTSSTPVTNHAQIEETKQLVSDTLKEVRSLSKILNADVIIKNGLIASLTTEVERFNRLNFLEANFKVTGETQEINSADEIIIFRILQEFFSNVIKHAKAKKLYVLLEYQKNVLLITAEDNGVGFDPQQKTENSGLATMTSRAEVLGADIQITSIPDKGTTLTLKYPFPHD